MGLYDQDGKSPWRGQNIYLKRPVDHRTHCGFVICSIIVIFPTWGERSPLFPLNWFLVVQQRKPSIILSEEISSQILIQTVGFSSSLWNSLEFPASLSQRFLFSTHPSEADWLVSLWNIDFSFKISDWKILSLALSHKVLWLKPDLACKSALSFFSPETQTREILANIPLPTRDAGMVIQVLPYLQICIQHSGTMEVFKT